MAWTFGAAWALGSGAAMVLLGLSLLRLRPRRASTMLFAGFCLAWGAQILVANVARGLHPSPYDEVLILLGAALLPPAYLFLGRFVTGFPFPADRRVAGGLVGLLALLAAGTAAAAILSPGLLLEGVERFPTFFAPRYGPAFLYLVTVPFFATFDFAALWLLHVLRGAKGASRQQVRFMLAGVLLFVSYINVAGFLPLVMAPAGEAVLLGLFGAGTLLVAVVAAQLAAQRPPEGPDPLLLACVLVPAAAAAAEAGLAVAGVSGIVQTLGLWRLLGIGLVAYAIARFQVFDIEVRLKHSFAQAAPYGAAGLAAAAALTAFETAGLGVAMGVMVATGAAAGLVTLWRKEAAARMLFPAETSNPQYLYHRRIEVYRAALERLLAEKTPDPADEQILGKLRRSLGITNREHQLLEYMVRERLAAGAAAPRPSAKAEVGALLAERFRILRVLGEGAYGRAYLAQDERLEREVVVKAVHAAAGAEDAKLLAREARIAGALRHPNVLAIYDVVEAPSDAFIVMEYADGGSLDQVLSRKGRLPLEEAVGVVDQLLSGLAAAHAAGIVHRDIKPSNLLLSKDGVVKLADFGVARRPGKDATFLASAPVGTLAYMSPEQVDMRAVDARSDLYAVGVMFYELLTGRFYLKMGGKDQFEVCELIRHASPLLPLEDQPAWVNEVLAGALAKDPAQRFRSAEAMRDALLQQAVPQAVMTNRA